MYLVAIIDWFSRHVLSWRLSNTLDGSFCLEALDDALSQSRPEVFNSDQGSQFTSVKFTGRLISCGVAISMQPGRWACVDYVSSNVCGRSVKYEDIYLRDYADGWEAEEGLGVTFSSTANDGSINRRVSGRRCRCIRKVAADAARVIRKDEGDPLEASKNTSKCFDSLESEPSRR